MCSGLTTQQQVHLTNQLPPVTSRFELSIFNLLFFLPLLTVEALSKNLIIACRRVSFHNIRVQDQRC